jgi:hypothetical protein
MTNVALARCMLKGHILGAIASRTLVLQVVEQVICLIVLMAIDIPVSVDEDILVVSHSNPTESYHTDTA